MAQYFKLKAKHPDAILLYRVGDFYETFGEDAEKAAHVLGIVLTSRNNGGSDMPLAGFPFHSLDVYLPRLVRAGYRVAICEQLEKPSKEKKIVDRGITDVVTPGLATTDSLLDRRSNNFLASIHYTNANLHGIAFIDLSTGEFVLTETDTEGLTKLMDSFQPSEVIYPRSFQAYTDELFGTRYYTYALDDWIFSYDFTREKLLDSFRVQNLKGFGVEEYVHGQVAAGAILHYLSTTQNKNLSHLTSIQRIPSDEYMWLDRFTIRNLELVQCIHDSGKSLLDVLDHTSSAMGARLMRRWLLMPLLDQVRIASRHDGVDFFLHHETIALTNDAHIKQIGDLERIISKVSLEKINPREVIQLRKALELMVPIKEALLSSERPHLVRLGEQINPCQSAIDLIAQALEEEAPVALGKGDTIKAGFNAELDDLRHVIRNSKQLLLDLQQREIERTGIPTLKIGFNSVFGYYLEVTNKYKHYENIPPDWVRKQSLSNAERYVTDELKQLEDKILHAEERILDLEAKLYLELIQSLKAYIHPIQHNAKMVAETDCLISFAKVASNHHYCRPVMDDSLLIDIRQGRHPVIELQLRLDEKYIANDTLLDNNGTQIMMITGPNMSGKSALLRQTALIVLMAQAGSFVPADGATIGIVDKLFTRVGASDNISSGESTFMVEMNETASIMNNISDRSLILLDEIGRGTSTYDGISIAWSLAEYLHNNERARPKTLFATHYHELNELAQSHPRIHNFHVSTKEVGNKVIFLRKLTEGGSEHSFGIHVAAMAGMPRPIIDRAAEILLELEKKSIETEGQHGAKDLKKKVSKLPASAYQLSIFETHDPQAGKLREMIQQLDLTTMTPIECMIKLNELKKIIEEGK
ncbi:MAG: DNA mismatch repair protein MutS [Saprospiraceae bacterium]|nr:DNA mismatch repair protein MutS [Saprospiraceae bacterium]